VVLHVNGTQTPSTYRKRPKGVSICEQYLLVIDLEAETIEDFDDYSVDDILSVAGILKPGEAQEMLDHIRDSREGWGQ
jgi:hypothetical protein